jgi:hypothetical protein
MDGSPRLHEPCLNQCRPDTDAGTPRLQWKLRDSDLPNATCLPFRGLYSWALRPAMSCMLSAMTFAPVSSTSRWMWLDVPYNRERKPVMLLGLEHRCKIAPSTARKL